MRYRTSYPTHFVYILHLINYFFFNLPHLEKETKKLKYNLTKIRIKISIENTRLLSVRNYTNHAPICQCSKKLYPKQIPLAEGLLELV